MQHGQLGRLPDDILLGVASHLTVQDILALRKTCRALAKFTKLRHVWVYAAERAKCLGGSAVPPYCEPVADLSSSQLEVFVRHAKYLRSLMAIGKSPAVSVGLNGARPVTWVHILLGRWLLTAISDSSTSALSLWSLSAVFSAGQGYCTSKPSAVATAYLEGPVAEGLVDVQDGRVVIALEIRSPDAFGEILSISSKAGAPVFVRLARLPGVSRILLLHGSTLGFALYNETSIPCIMNWKTKEVVQLRELPDVTGGCLAMATNGTLLAIVTAKRLEVYAHDSKPSSTHPSYRQVCQVDLPYAVLDAVPTFIPPSHCIDHDADGRQSASWTIRLCLASEQGLSVYDIAAPSRDAEAVLDTIWVLDPDHREDTRPIFGRQPQSLSWFSARRATTWSHVGFSTATLRLHPPSSSPSSLLQSPISEYEFSSHMSPALHYMGVRDYDETLGILVLANACGELCVYDISGRYLSHLDACLPGVAFPAVDEDALLPTEPVKAISAPPYPWSEVGPGFRDSPGPIVRDAALRRWRTEQLPNALENWTTELHTLGHNIFPWWYFVCCVGQNFAWALERREHLLGTITPLLYGFDTPTIIFKAGGLLCVLFVDSNDGYVLQHGVDPLAAARALDDNRINDYVAHKIRAWNEPFLEARRPLFLWEWESFMFGRNRWEEYEERGGQADPEWVTKRRFVSIEALTERSTS